MRITTIGDIHGRDGWREIVKKTPSTKFIFSGDYLDPYRNEKIDPIQTIENFQEIIDFKTENPDKVILLIGNHDAQYLFPPRFATTRRMIQFFQEISDIFWFNKDKFQFAYQRGNYLWTHAGVTNGWLIEFYDKLKTFGLKDDFSNLADSLNNAGKSATGLSIYDKVSMYRGGFDKNGSPIWADTEELAYDMLDNCHQITGHNRFLDIHKIGDKNSSITFVDCLFEKNVGYTINI